MTHKIKITQPRDGQEILYWFGHILRPLIRQILQIGRSGIPRPIHILLWPKNILRHPVRWVLVPELAQSLKRETKVVVVYLQDAKLLALELRIENEACDEHVDVRDGTIPQLVC